MSQHKPEAERLSSYLLDTTLAGKEARRRGPLRSPPPDSSSDEKTLAAPTSDPVQQPQVLAAGPLAGFEVTFMAGFEVTTEGNMTIWAARKGILAGIY